MQPDRDYLQDVLARLLNTPSPSGMTDAVVHVATSELDSLGIPYELTRRGAIRACLKGRQRMPARAVVAHLDTLGAMVKGYKPNGRLQVVPIGFWSSRFAEGARVTIYSDEGVIHRGTLLPAKASGHTFNAEIDSQPVSWDNIELRIDARTASEAETRALGIHVGDTIAIPSNPEFGPEGFVNARHLDDKAGVAAILAALHAIRESGMKLPVDCFPLFTISEEIGVGASHVLHGDVAELISIDNGTVAEGQYTSEYGVTISMQDSSGPFDWHLTRRLLELCQAEGIEHSRDVFRFYRSDAAAAIEAGNDIRTALVCFGLDASHGHERVHLDSLDALARLLIAYLCSPPLFHRDRAALGPLDDFPPAEMQTPQWDENLPTAPHS
ncbi:osmoprotectant NAGGN system M42 family peptidase [Aromatoleum petrolei]|uniref:Osmoprotectant NAGGN system M42 family peptidase n=1 Tax=Aromatoleum petrolei TaxID=76116 RepID=A0ABX1MM85_9RHOO|nr:osmoprotectant NAGGN system M42 family peptidase [Aromatoleum petrolei]NMF88311.1 osmoprotectant NAGGN system M42 family peptidase [Aromatoleum petrolei]QTQ37991.1 Peptidase, M42 family [Aromatoleum petrolei]